MSLQFEDSTYNEEISKILFTGLDNSGKTSIILALQREISQIALLKPTRQAQRKIFEYLGKQIAEWDLGGQKRYRIAYLKEPTKYFDNTSVCIYVIDIQDKARLGESLSYFKDVIKQFKTLEITPLIFIFFHKMDPDFVKEENVHIKGLISDLKEKIKKITKDEFETYFNAETTIYDLWSIVSAFSQILLKIYPQSDLLDKTIQEFAETIDAEGILILDSNSLVIGQYFQDNDAQNILTKATPYFLSLDDSFKWAQREPESMIVKRGNKTFFFDYFKISKTEDPIYIIIMKNADEFPEENIDAFKNMLQTLI